MRKRLSSTIVLFCFMSATVFGQSDMKNLIKENFNFAAQQYKELMKQTPPDRMPKTYDSKNNKLVSSSTKWWCSGFYPGSLWYIFEHTNDAVIKAEAERRLLVLEKEKHFTGNHDLGFMMFCSFGTAYRITGNPSYKATIDTAAASLSTRYRPAINVIQSWESSTTYKCPVIIDNMMNLELLYWVSANGGDNKYKDIATIHANTTMKNHFRPDYSSYHLLDYDLKTGNVLRKMTDQGAADESAWARGQSWGFYGYTMMYRFSKDKKYLNQAKKIAAFWLNHPNLPSDGIPFWDFNAPAIPNTYRDASAAAVMASGLLELGQYVSKKEKKKYVLEAEKIIRSLSSDAYRSKLGENGGFLLLHSAGAVPHKSEIDVPLSYADYYFLEALHRYEQWYL